MAPEGEPDGLQDTRNVASSSGAGCTGCSVCENSPTNAFMVYALSSVCVQ